MSRRQKTDFHKESRFFVQQGKQHLLREDFFPRGVIACSVESHVVHDIEAVGGIHCAAAIYISGGDLFRCQSAVIAYGNVGDVEHSVEDISGVDIVAAIEVAASISCIYICKSNIMFPCVSFGERAGIATNDQIIAVIKSTISNACHTFRNGDCL